MADSNASESSVGSTSSPPGLRTSSVTVLQPGDRTNRSPYSIAIVANPALETDRASGVFFTDPILGDLRGFDTTANYVVNVLFGRLPGQLEQLLADPAIGPRIRVVKLFDPSPPATDSNSLVEQWVERPQREGMVAPRPCKFNAFLSGYGISADVAFAVTSSTYRRASAYATTDDRSRPGVPFTVDGRRFVHRYFCRIPGTVALPVLSRSLTALHEFGHAVSSYSDGYLTDQYVDSAADLNNKLGRPIPAAFGTIDGVSFASDVTRDGLGYLAGWKSYHPELTNTAAPSVMDDYTLAPGRVSEACQFDQLTRKFIRERLLAKLGR